VFKVRCVPDKAAVGLTKLLSRTSVILSWSAKAGRIESVRCLPSTGVGVLPMCGRRVCANQRQAAAGLDVLRGR
jgi:hypothetical protein